MYLDLFDRTPYGTNCWLLSADGAPDAVVVDPGFEPEAVRSLLADAGKGLAAVLLTHAHLDHAWHAGDMAVDAPVFIHAADAPAFSDVQAWNPGFPNPLAPVHDLRTVQDGDVLGFAGFSIEVMHTPGHTPGHCCFLTDAPLVLSGDLVFAGSIGRSDFPNSDPEAMRTSLERFMGLPDDLRVLPGHGPETQVGAERASNPFLVGMGA